MKCTDCGVEISASAKFCPECGSKIENQTKTCLNGNCGRTELPQEAKFCPDCGTKFTTNNCDKDNMDENTNDSFSKGIHYYKGDEGYKQDYFAAFECFSKASNEGDARAQYYLGYCYDKGLGIKPDLKLAFDWLLKSANQGEAKALYHLGYWYLNGFRDVEKNEYKAAEFFTKAANKGIVNAQYYLGYCYFYGKGLPIDQTKAVEIFKKVAELGYVKALSILGTAYEQGWGVPRNIEVAISYYKKAAECGDKNAINGYKRLKNSCFITSAVCLHNKKSDDCYELMSLRWFRDNWLVHEKGGIGLIEEYHIIAPEIVEKINRKSNHNEIYKYLNETYIKECVNLIEMGKYQETKIIYIQMVNWLKNI